MKVFVCQSCGQMLHFENTVCVRCGSAVGFLPGPLTLSTLTLDETGSFAALAQPGTEWRACGNAATAGCNWLVPAEAETGFCVACGLNRMIPDLDLPENIRAWRAIETAKRRLVYALMRLGLPLTSRHDDEERGLAFDFLADTAHAGPVMTGHANGLITINIAEADSAERERRRVELGEPYRTLLGHMRHEVGHYYWDVLVRDGGHVEAARAVFGDERQDYGEALQRYYRDGPPDWQSSYVSAYATMHPWEDFAETWTHYLHIVDTLDTAASFGLAVDPDVSDDPDVNAEIEGDPYRARKFDRLIRAWLPLTTAINSLNRSMGQPDLYPFVLSEPAVAKLAFVHDLVRSVRG